MGWCWSALPRRHRWRVVCGVAEVSDVTSRILKEYVEALGFTPVFLGARSRACWVLLLWATLPSAPKSKSKRGFIWPCASIRHGRCCLIGKVLDGGCLDAFGPAWFRSPFVCDHRGCRTTASLWWVVEWIGRASRCFAHAAIFLLIGDRVLIAATMVTAVFYTMIRELWTFVCASVGEQVPPFNYRLRGFAVVQRDGMGNRSVQCREYLWEASRCRRTYLP